MSFAPRLSLPSALALASGLAALACATTPLGSTETNYGKAARLPGADIYGRACASCHGQRGEGLAQSPPVMGASALPLYERDPSTTSNPAFQDIAEQQRKQSLPPGADTRGAFRTAADVYKYVSREMPLPKTKAGSLTPQEYWAVVNFLLVGHGSAVPAGGITEANAASVEVKPAN
jgi:mono/diheme cytochrome c family protein